jgi:hypothetical protein
MKPFILTPTEVLHEYPEAAKKFKWTAKHIGIFLATGLLEGTCNRGKRVSLIESSSVEKLIAYRNSVPQG